MEIEIKFLKEGDGWYIFINGVCDSTIRFATRKSAEKQVIFLKGVDEDANNR